MFAVISIKFRQKGIFVENSIQKVLSEALANSKKPDQTAPLVCSFKKS